MLTETPGERSRPFADIRREIEALLDAQQSVVKREEIAQPDYEDARFAVVAWVDEMIMRCPELSGTWRGALLQANLYRSANAGEEFFERLAGLSTGRRQTIELYHLVLCLAFRGRYYDESQEPQLLELRRQYGAYLSTPLIDPLDFEKRQEHLTPQPYTISAPPFRPLSRRTSPVWLALPVIAVAALLLWYFVPHRPSLRCVQKAVAGFDCADIVAAVDQSGVTLGGHISSDQEHDEVLRKVGVECSVKTPVIDHLSVIPRPFCQVMDLLAPFKDNDNQEKSGLTITPSKGCDATYHSGENVVVDIKATRPLRYLYVDYYDAGRQNVTHLLPNQYTPDNALNDAESLILPGANDRWQMKIQYPFGREMVTAVSSPKPLFPSPRPAGEPANEYLAALGEAIKADVGETPKVDDTNLALAAAYCFTVSVSR